MWIKFIDQLPPEGVFVHTKLEEDGMPAKNFERLKRLGRLLLLSDGTYIYYNPTHWFKV